jgi:citrate synthase
MSEDCETITTRIWSEVPASDHPFVTERRLCRGYDVFGDMLGRASWVEMLFLLFQPEPPSATQARLLESLAFILSNPGPRDPSVHAAMAAGTGGSPAAACLMAALSVGAGGTGGARDVWNFMQLIERWGDRIDNWQDALPDPENWRNKGGIWPLTSHPPGFDPNGTDCPLPIRQSLDHLAGLGSHPHLAWLRQHRLALEACAQRPLAMTAIAAAALADLGFDADQGEMLFLLLRLPGAAAHALEQKGLGYRKFPFFKVELENDPGSIQASKSRHE